MHKQTNTKAKRLVTTVWDEAEVAKRALELYDLECAARWAHDHMIACANDFKEREGIDRVEHSNPKFRRYTAEALAAVIKAKREVQKARARFKTACCRCPRVNVPRLKTPTPRMTTCTERRLFSQ